MDAQVFLLVSAGIAVLIIAFSVMYITFHLVEAIKSLKMSLDNIEDTTKEVRLAKNTLKVGAWSILSTVLGLLLKKGGGRI